MPTTLRAWRLAVEKHPIVRPASLESYREHPGVRLGPRSSSPGTVLPRSPGPVAAPWAAEPGGSGRNCERPGEPGQQRRTRPRAGGMLAGESAGDGGWRRRMNGGRTAVADHRGRAAPDDLPAPSVEFRYEMWAAPV